MLLRCLSAIGSIKAEMPIPADYPVNPLTFADHLLKRRMDLKLTQYEASIQLKVTECSVFNWENSRSLPKVKHYPDIISFLGYNPFESEIDTETLHGKLQWHRTRLGLSYRNLGRIIGVNGSTIAEWEEGLRPIRPANLNKLVAWIMVSSLTSEVHP